jgi:hypothetical protein
MLRGRKVSTCLGQGIGSMGFAFSLNRYMRYEPMVINMHTNVHLH